MTIKATGSQTATIGVEHTLATITDLGSYVSSVDISNTAAGDEGVIRVYKKVRASSSSELIYPARFSHISKISNIIESIPVRSNHEYILTLEQTAGTGRSYDWEVSEL